MKRTPEQVAADYTKFRGRCRELAEAECAADRRLRLVRGHYFCPLWGTNEQHWWCERSDGAIVDPTAMQFPSGCLGFYEEFDGICECSNCGKEIPISNEQHWWCERSDGAIVDPTAMQFPSGCLGFYEEFDGICECSNCGKEIHESEASFESNYVFCSYKCHGQFVGVL